jgi:hypothetical protein
VRHDGLPDRGVSRQHVDHPGRHAGGLGGLGQDERVERRLWCRLEHNGAAGGQGGGDFRGGRHDGAVERDDRADDTRRLPDDEGGRHCALSDLTERERPGEADKIVEDGHRTEFPGVSEGQRDAGLVNVQFGERPGPLGQIARHGHQRVGPDLG